VTIPELSLLAGSSELAPALRRIDAREVQPERGEGCGFGTLDNPVRSTAVFVPSQPQYTPLSAFEYALQSVNSGNSDRPATDCRSEIPVDIGSGGWRGT
jgi:hypothetical protein